MNPSKGFSTLRVAGSAPTRQAGFDEPGNPEYWYNLGTLLHEQRKDSADAIDALARVAALSPTDYRVLRNLTNSQQDTRRFRDALSTTDKILAAFGEEDPWLLETRGDL